MPTDPTQIPQLVNSGATDHNDASGAPPAAQPQPAPASDQQMIAQGADVTSHGMPSVVPGATPTPTLASQGQPPAAQPAAPQTPHEIHQSLYQKALSILAPPTKYVDAQGNPQQTRPSLSNSILSGAIAGMLTPTAYRQGSFGPIADPQQTAFNAAQAGANQRKEQDANVQKQVDDKQTRMLGVAKSNADLMHLYSATMQDSDKMEGLAQGQVDNFAPTLQTALDHDQNLQGTDTKAILASGMTMQQALQHPEFRDALLKHSLIPDGVIQVDDGHGNQVPTQTFSVIDPHVSLSVTKEVADIASQLNPQWKIAFDASNGSMKMKLGQMQQITNQVNSVQYAERIFDDAAKSDDPNLQELGLKGDINGEIMSAVRQGAPGAAQARQTLMALENAKAAGGTTADVLNRLINDPETAPGRGYILNALGLTVDNAQKYIDAVTNERIRQNKLAQEGARGDKAPVDPAVAKANLQTLGKKLNLTDAEIESSQDKSITTAGQYNKAVTALNAQYNANRTYTAANPAVDNPKGLVGEEYLATQPVEKQNMLRMYGEGRAEISPRIAATKQGKALVEQIVTAYPGYDVTKAPSYAKLRTDITSGKDSAGISRGNAAINHAGLFYDHISYLSTLPGIKTFDKLAAGDAAKLEIDREAVASELAGAYKGGSAAPTQDEIKDWKDKLNGKTPQILKTQIQEALRLLRGKVQTYDDKWAATAPTTVPVPSNVFSQESRNTYSRVTGEKLPPRVDDVVTVKGQKMRITNIGEDGNFQAVPYGGR